MSLAAMRLQGRISPDRPLARNTREESEPRGSRQVALKRLPTEFTKALKAVELDEQLAEVHLSLANIKHYYDWDWAGAEAAFGRALELDPSGMAFDACELPTG